MVGVGVIPASKLTLILTAAGRATHPHAGQVGWPRAKQTHLKNI